MLVYNPKFTHQSFLAKDFLTDLNALCKRDYGRTFFRDSLLCIDLDSYECSISGDNDATMDAALGIADYVHNRESNSCHFLMELRFGYKSIRNIDLSNMKRKVAHSRDILHSEQVYNRVAFLYEEQVAPLAKNYFSRFSKQYSELRSWEAMDVNSFINFVKDKSTLPYQPENDMEEIERGFRDKLSFGEVDNIDGLLKYWITQMEKYDLRYNYMESKAIAEVILKVLDSIDAVDGSLESEYLCLLKDDVRPFLHNRE